VSTISTADLDALIEELTVDCYNDEEQLTGLLTGAEKALVVGEIAARNRLLRSLLPPLRVTSHRL
jgi:hypothetical protein